MKMFFLILGLFVLILGLLWIGQGLGYVNWPANSFMISKIKWAYYGGCVVVVAIIIIWLSWN